MHAKRLVLGKNRHTGLAEALLDIDLKRLRGEPGSCSLRRDVLNADIYAVQYHAREVAIVGPPLACCGSGMHLGLMICSGMPTPVDCRWLPWPRSSPSSTQRSRAKSAYSRRNQGTAVRRRPTTTMAEPLARK